MAKVRKMLGAADSPYILSLMALIETQSVRTIARWCIDYTKAEILPIYEKTVPSDPTPMEVLEAAEGWLGGTVKTAELKKIVVAARGMGKGVAEHPAAEAAAKTVLQAAGCCYTPTHSLGLAFYGAAAIAYDRVGTEEKPAVYDEIAAEECGKMEAALRKIAVEQEPNPAKINWYCERS